MSRSDSLHHASEQTFELGTRITLKCTDASGRVNPITLNERDPLGECIKQLTFGGCAGTCLDVHGRIKARIRLVTVSGEMVNCCTEVWQYGLHDDDYLQIVFVSVENAPLEAQLYGCGRRQYCNGCDEAVELRARRRTVEPVDTNVCTQEQVWKLFYDWRQDFILNPSGWPWKGLTNEQQQRMNKNAQRSAFKAYVRKYFGDHKQIAHFYEFGFWQ